MLQVYQGWEAARVHKYVHRGLLEGHASADRIGAGSMHGVANQPRQQSQAIALAMRRNTQQTMRQVQHCIAPGVGTTAWPDLARHWTPARARLHGGMVAVG